MSTSGQVITCKAAVLWESKKPISIEEIQVDPPESDEIRVKITNASICHTDISSWEGKDGFTSFPRILGHEGSGIIESLGQGVTEFQIDDHVVIVFQTECRSCPLCKSGKTNACLLFLESAATGLLPKAQNARFSVNGKPVYHFMSVSTFSEYTVVHKANVAKVRKTAPLEKVCLLSCGVPTGLGSVWNLAQVEQGSSVLIIGLGTVGLAVAEGAKNSGASRIIGIDTDPSRLLKAKEFGVTDVLNPNDNEKPIQQVVYELTQGGVDYSFECVGNVDLMRDALACLHAGWGTSVIVGCVRYGEIATFQPPLLMNHVWKYGTFGGYKGPSDVPKLVDLVLKQEISLDKFITHNLPFSCFNKAFELFIEKKCLKCVLHF